MACPNSLLAIEAERRTFIAVFVTVALDWTTTINLIAVDSCVLGMELSLEPTPNVIGAQADFTKG